MTELSADDKRMIADAVEASAQGKAKKHDVLKVIHFVEKTGLSPLLDEISFLYRGGTCEWVRVYSSYRHGKEN